LLVFGALIWLVSPKAFAQGVSVYCNHVLDFTMYHSYAWGQQPNLNQVQSTFPAQEAQHQINYQLQSKGLTMVPEDQNADLIVVTTGSVHQQTPFIAWGRGGGCTCGGAQVSTRADTSVVGTFVIELYDVKAKQLAWLGSAQGPLNKEAEKNWGFVYKAVASMFKKYPLEPPKH
jgi:hypothetical protein